MANIEFELDNSFKTVGMIVNAKISSYRNEGKEHDALELEKACEILNKHFDNKMAFNNVEK